MTIQNPLYTNGINKKKGEEHLSKVHQPRQPEHGCQKPPPHFHQRRRKKFQHLERPNRIMLDNKRRIGERKSKICLFHYPHDKIPPQKKKKKQGEFKTLNITQKQPHKKPQRKTITNGPCKRKKERTRVVLEHRRTNRTITRTDCFEDENFESNRNFCKQKGKKENLQFLKQDLNLNRPNVSRIQSSN